MRRIIGSVLTAAATSLLVACGGGGGGTTGGGGSGGSGTGGSTGGSGGGAPQCNTGGAPATGVPHVIVVIQENHTFDNYFGKWCTAPAGSSPTCTQGPSCCEAMPDKEPAGASPVVLDDTGNAAFDPDHTQACELAEINAGKMDQFVTMSDPAMQYCVSPNNFALAGDVVKPYHDLATKYALADRYFQSIAGQSSANDMYFAVAQKVFLDNAAKPDAVGKECNVTTDVATYQGQTIADLLTAAGKRVTWYGEGYAKMKAQNGACPTAPADCGFHLPVYPCVYDPADVPFLYYEQYAHDPDFVQDYTKLAEDLAGNVLPDVSFVKALGYHTEHPGFGTKVSPGVQFVTDLVAAVEQSCYRDNTLILLTWDEGGGFFDHVSPPPNSTIDDQPYGTRVPLLAIGPYAKQGEVSHVEMEHSSIVKFLEWNYLDGKTGQLGARDGVVNNIGSLLDPAKVGAAIPDQ